MYVCCDLVPTYSSFAVAPIQMSERWIEEPSTVASRLQYFVGRGQIAPLYEFRWRWSEQTAERGRAERDDVEAVGHTEDLTGQ